MLSGRAVVGNQGCVMKRKSEPTETGWYWDEDTTTGAPPQDQAGSRERAEITAKGPAGLLRTGRRGSNAIGPHPVAVQAEGTSPSPRGRGRLPVVVGVPTFIVLAVLGIVLISSRPVSYTADLAVVVVPSKKVSVEQAAALFDSLSRGQVVATAAEIYQQRRWRSDASEVVISAGNVAPSSVINITAVGRSPEEVVEVLSGVVSRATPEANRLLNPYTVLRLDEISPEVETAGLGRPLQYGLVALAALFGAALMAQLSVRLERWFQRRS